MLDLRAALAALPDDDRALLLMRYGLEMTQPGVAAVLGMPEGTVKVRLHRLRMQLRRTPQGTVVTQAANTIDRRIIKALGHPLRMELLTLLHLKEASPSDLAAELGVPLANVSYHMRLLARLECIELVRREQRRGAVEHYYRATERPYIDDAEWAALPPTIRHSVSAAVLRQIWRDTRDALESGSLDSRPTRHLSRMPLIVDDEGFDAMNGVLTEALERAEAVQADSLARLAERGEGGTSSLVVLMHYEASAGAAEPAAPRPPRKKRAKRA